MEDELGLYEYNLPSELIAQEPARSRDGSRLLHLDGETGRIGHGRFSDLVDILCPDDVLVVNRTKVVPARLLGRKKTGGKVEVLLLSIPEGRPGQELVEGLVKGAKGLRPGLEFEFGQSLRARVVEVHEYGRCGLEFKGPDRDWIDLLNKLGRIPLPPYIKRAKAPREGSEDAARYQTVYAEAAGAVAAPTAGLHFTPRILERLEAKGIERVSLTLHVGYGTFEPLRLRHLEERRLHPEPYFVSERAAESLNRAVTRGRRLVAVGTSTARLLEHLAHSGGFCQGAGKTELFIRPGFTFKAVGAMVTNFHLPGTSLLMLVSALAGRERILAAYGQAVRKKYRFYSFGDAMFIEADPSVRDLKD